MNENNWSNPCPKYDCRKAACKCGLEYVNIPASLGDDSEGSNVAPKNGAYCNALVIYEANNHVYIYSKEGVPTLIDVDASDISTLEQEVRKAQRDIVEFREEIDKFAYFFNTVADMRASTQLSNGDYARTYGFYNLNDGGGAYYKIRTLEDGEVADGKFVILVGNFLVAELITDKKVNLLQVGGQNNFSDCCNYLIQNGYDIYVPVGEYVADSQITFAGDRTIFECDGDITCSGEFTLFLITGQKNTIKSNGKITGHTNGNTRLDTLVQIGGPSHPKSASYNNVFIEEALLFAKGIYFAPDGGGKGAAYNDIRFTHIQANIGIHLKSGQTGANWINENVFTGGRLDPAQYGIYFEKGGPDQTDPYNGNKFYHIAIEPARTYQVGIKMEYGQHNYFEQMRLSEGVGTGYYVELDAGVSYNTFNNCSRVSISKFIDHNTDPQYYNHFQFSGIRDDEWHMLAKECYTVGGTIFVPDGYVMNLSYFYGDGEGEPLELYGNLTCNGMTLGIGSLYHNTDLVYTLPNTFGPYGVTEFIIRIIWKGNNCSFTFNWPDGTLAIPDSALNYVSSGDRFLCRYVNNGTNHTGTWLVQPMQ